MGLFGESKHELELRYKKMLESKVNDLSVLQDRYSLLQQEIDNNKKNKILSDYSIITEGRLTLRRINFSCLCSLDDALKSWRQGYSSSYDVVVAFLNKVDAILFKKAMT